MSSRIAAMLAEAESEAEMAEMPAPIRDPFGGEEDELMEEADEGQMVATEEMLLAFEERNPQAFMQALRSFIRMTN